MPTAIVTGASGFIGARIARRLLERQWRVHALGRDKHGQDCESRIRAAIGAIDGRDPSAFPNSNLQCHAIRFKDGVPVALEGLPCISGDAVLFHSAGDIRFNPGDPASQRLANIDSALIGVRALRSRIARAVHVSTAYVCGDRSGLIMESDLDCGQAFHNPYERSKHDAEIAMAALCRELDLPLSVVRPSIVVNDTESGRAASLTHLNALGETLTRVQRHFGIGDGEFVSEKIRIPIAPEARPNLAQVDPLVEALVTLGVNPDAAGRTFHLCHPAPQTNAELIDIVAETFGVKGKIRLEYVALIPDNPTWTERMILRSMRPYLPYLNSSCAFDLTNTRTFAPGYDVSFPPLDVEYLKKVVAFQRGEKNI